MFGDDDNDEEVNEKSYKWNVEPHPYDSSFDVFVTDSDKEALEAILHAAEMHLWDSAEPGQERVLKVRYNGTESKAGAIT